MQCVRRLSGNNNNNTNNNRKMATYSDESLESYVYASYNPYSYRCPKPKSWRQKSYLSAYGDGEGYFNNYHRAQLKSILSQINPNLTPRLRKANTKDVGVQVNPKADASVQCSLGPRTLAARRRDAERRRAPDGQSPSSPVSPGVRFPRTQAVYSPIATRGLAALLHDHDDDDDDDKKQQQKCEGRTEDAESTDKPEEEVVEGKEPNKPKSKTTLSPGKNDDESEQLKEEDDDGDKIENEKSLQEDSKSKGRVRFQFLEQKYGYYHCRDCNLRWESAYVWCVQGTNKVYFKQFCRTCQKSFNPYRVEDITCQSCKKARCTCPETARHVDPKRPHRQDLCGRCKGKRLSCDSTFSFKYII
ncbi:zygote arrest protein 1 [Tachysurus vachellii]|uniref:zygote arrest protein 1 n=1 Tax=Tachysurus vachellii TaxID=175792 RepID=UPI00296B3973|nr:zygote arrest protein 1 [Tachysurus vachellii]